MAEIEPQVYGTIPVVSVANAASNNGSVLAMTTEATENPNKRALKALSIQQLAASLISSTVSSYSSNGDFYKVQKLVSNATNEEEEDSNIIDLVPVDGLLSASDAANIPPYKFKEGMRIRFVAPSSNEMHDSDYILDYGIESGCDASQIYFESIDASAIRVNTDQDSNKFFISEALNVTSSEDTPSIFTLTDASRIKIKFLNSVDKYLTKNSFIKFYGAKFAPYEVVILDSNSTNREVVDHCVISYEGEVGTIQFTNISNYYKVKYGIVIEVRSLINLSGLEISSVNSNLAHNLIFKGIEVNDVAEQLLIESSPTTVNTGLFGTSINIYKGVTTESILSKISRVTPIITNRYSGLPVINSELVYGNTFWAGANNTGRFIIAAPVDSNGNPKTVTGFELQRFIFNYPKNLKIYGLNEVGGEPTELYNDELSFDNSFTWRDSLLGSYNFKYYQVVLTGVSGSNYQYYMTSTGSTLVTNPMIQRFKLRTTDSTKSSYKVRIKFTKDGTNDVAGSYVGNSTKYIEVFKNYGMTRLDQGDIKGGQVVELCYVENTIQDPSSGASTVYKFFILMNQGGADSLSNKILGSGLADGIGTSNSASGRLGEIITVADSNIRINTLPCDGRLISKTKHPDLFELIQYTYGRELLQVLKDHDYDDQESMPDVGLTYHLKPNQIATDDGWKWSTILKPVDCEHHWGTKSIRLDKTYTGATKFRLSITTGKDRFNGYVSGKQFFYVKGLANIIINKVQVNKITLGSQMSVGGMNFPTGEKDRTYVDGKWYEVNSRTEIGTLELPIIYDGIAKVASGSKEFLLNGITLQEDDIIEYRVMEAYMNTGNGDALSSLNFACCNLTSSIITPKTVTETIDIPGNPDLFALPNLNNPSNPIKSLIFIR